MLKLHDRSVLLSSTLTSPMALDKIWMILSCGVATTLCPFISMMRCPTRMPPLSAMPPLIRLQICSVKQNRLERRVQKWQKMKSKKKKSDIQCHPQRWSQAGTWDLASWWSPRWPEDSEQYWASHIFGFSSPRKHIVKRHLITQIFSSFPVTHKG